MFLLCSGLFLGTFLCCFSVSGSQRCWVLRLVGYDVSLLVASWSLCDKRFHRVLSLRILNILLSLATVSMGTLFHGILFLFIFLWLVAFFQAVVSFWLFVLLRYLCDVTLKLMKDYCSNFWVYFGLSPRFVVPVDLLFACALFWLFVFADNLATTCCCCCWVMWSSNLVWIIVWIGNSFDAVKSWSQGIFVASCGTWSMELELCSWELELESLGVLFAWSSFSAVWSKSITIEIFWLFFEYMVLALLGLSLESSWQIHFLEEFVHSHLLCLLCTGVDWIVPSFMLAVGVFLGCL